MCHIFKKLYYDVFTENDLFKLSHIGGLNELLTVNGIERKIDLVLRKKLNVFTM